MQLVNDVPPPLERLVGHRSWSPSRVVLWCVLLFLQHRPAVIDTNSYVKMINQGVFERCHCLCWTLMSAEYIGAD